MDSYFGSDYEKRLDAVTKRANLALGKRDYAKAVFFFNFLNMDVTVEDDPVLLEGRLTLEKRPELRKKYGYEIAKIMGYGVSGKRVDSIKQGDDSDYSFPQNASNQPEQDVVSVDDSLEGKLTNGGYRYQKFSHNLLRKGGMVFEFNKAIAYDAAIVPYLGEYNKLANRIGLAHINFPSLPGHVKYFEEESGVSIKSRDDLGGLSNQEYLNYVQDTVEPFFMDGLKKCRNYVTDYFAKKKVVFERVEK